MAGECRVIFVVFIQFLSSKASHFHTRKGGNVGGLLGEPAGDWQGELPADQWMVQPLDHFNPSDTRTWKQVTHVTESCGLCVFCFSDRKIQFSHNSPLLRVDHHQCVLQKNKFKIYSDSSIYSPMAQWTFKGTEHTATEHRNVQWQHNFPLTTLPAGRNSGAVPYSTRPRTFRKGRSGVAPAPLPLPRSDFHVLAWPL